MSAPAPQQVLLIGGRSGAGKTTVAYEVSRQFEESGVAHYHLEGDSMDSVHPKPHDDPDGSRLTAANVAAVWGNVRALGHHRLIYVNTASILEPRLVTGAIGGAEAVVAVELTASDDTVAERLGGREIGGALEHHLGRSRFMAGVLARDATPGTVRIATDGRSVPEIAADVVTASGWR